MPDRQEDLIRRLLGQDADLPTTMFGRLRRTVGSAWLGRRLDEEVDPERLGAFVASVAQLKGVAMKMGQIMSYIDVALPPEARDALAVLQTHAQPMPAATVERILRDELGDGAEGLVAGLDPTPVAAASIGQVHRAVVDDRVVAVKVQYPEVREAILSDFRAAKMGPLFAGIVYPGARIGELMDEAKARFLEECDYRHEAAAQERFRMLHTEDPVLYVPRVHARLSSTRVLTTDFVNGVGLDGFLATDPPQALRDRYGEALFRFYVGNLFTHGLYNCDPHPGNYLFHDGRIALLDHGCTRSFPPETIRMLARLAQAVHEDDDPAIRQALREAGFAADASGRAFETAKRFLHAFHGPMLEPGRRRIALDDRMGLHDIVQNKRALMRIGLPGRFLFLLRIRFGLLSVLERLGAEADWHTLERAYVDGAVSRAV